MEEDKNTNIFLDSFPTASVTPNTAQPSVHNTGHQAANDSTLHSGQTSEGEVTQIREIILLPFLATAEKKTEFSSLAPMH